MSSVLSISMIATLLLLQLFHCLDAQPMMSMIDPTCVQNCLQRFTNDMQKLMTSMNGTRGINYDNYGDFSGNTPDLSRVKNYTNGMCSSFDSMKTCLQNCGGNSIMVIKYFVSLSLMCARREVLFSQLPCLMNISAQGFCSAESDKVTNASQAMLSTLQNMANNQQFANSSSVINVLMQQCGNLCKTAKTSLQCITPYIQSRCGDSSLQLSRDMYIASLDSLQQSLSSSGKSLSSVLPQECFNLFS